MIIYKTFNIKIDIIDITNILYMILKGINLQLEIVNDKKQNTINDIYFNSFIDLDSELNKLENLIDNELIEYNFYLRIKKLLIDNNIKYNSINNIEITLQWILIDKSSKDEWKTPNHHKDKKNDDWHGTDGVKNSILDNLDKKIKKIAGGNGDIEIKDGKIIVVSQIYNNKTGKKDKKPYPTDLNASDFFEKTTHYICLTILQNIHFININQTELNIMLDLEIIKITLYIEKPNQ